MKGACFFLGGFSVIFSTRVWSLPGKIETATTSLTASTALKTDPPFNATSSYGAIFNQTRSSSTRSSSLRASTGASYYGQSSIISTVGELAPFPSQAQSASSTVISTQSDSLSSPGLNTQQTTTDQSDSSLSPTPGSPMGQILTSGTPGSSPSMLDSASPTSSSTTSSFSFSIPSGYTLVKLSTSSSTEAVPSGFSLEALSTSTASDFFYYNSSLMATPSATLSLSQGSIKNLTLTRSNSSSLVSATSARTSNLTSSSASGSPSLRLNTSSISSFRISASPTSASINHTIVSTPSAPIGSHSLARSIGTNASFATGTGLSQASLSIPSAPIGSHSLARSIGTNASLATSTGLSQASLSSALAASAASVSSVASVASASKVAASETATAASCNDGTWDLTVANYLKANTDSNLKTWWRGGTDNDTGVTFPPKTAPGTFFTEALAGSFEPVGSQFVCTLEAHACQPADGCENYAVHIPQGVPQTGPARFFNEVGPVSHSGWFAIHSIANIFSFSETFTSGLTSAGIQLASENLQLTQTFTKPVNQQIALRAFLLGFSLLIAILFAFVPVVGEIAGATLAAGAIAGAAAIASTAISTTASFIGVSIANGASLDSKAETFGAYMALTFNNTAGAIDQLVSKLMNGDAINAPPGVTDPSLLSVLDGGLWVNSSVITNPNLSISAMTELMRDDLLSRGINYIWTQSKIYVTFANLNDDAAGTKCKADKNGWQASKTCADGGVYYLYRFNEDGNLEGHLDYPWGADKMTDSPFNLQPSWVTAGSAASYRAQNGGMGGFEYDQTNAPANLTNLLTEVGKTGTLDGLRTMPGVWNISVCDMGTHNDWNGDYTQKPMVTENKDNLSFFFPCCCGPNCLQTHDFVQSAQMENFKTIVHTCRTQLQPCNAWPPGVFSIDFGEAGVITNKSCINEDGVPPEPEPFLGPYA